MRKTTTYPPAVLAGATVGVAALSGRVDPERLERGISALSGMGFKVVKAENLEDSWNGFAGRDEQRVEAFHRLAARPEVEAIFFARGGHGVLRILPLIDWQGLARHPRYYIGYSDLTPFLNLVSERLGWVALHGPMVAADLARGLDEEERESLLSALRGCPKPIEDAQFRGFGGAVVGVLAGGCLSLLTATLGTPFAPNLGDRILFLEDVNEPAYRLDRMLTQLRLSGTLGGLKAMILGDFQPLDGVPNGDSSRLVEQALGAATPPLVSGVCCGHGARNLTLPIGALARLDPESGSLSFSADII